MSILYCPFPSEESALTLAKMLIEKKLIACAQILPPVKSVFQWDNEIKIEHEIVMILKTRKENFEIIEQLVLAHHPYEIPCLLELEVSRQNSSYLSWLLENTSQIR